MRDISNLREAMSAIHIPTIDEHVADAPHMLLDRTLYFWDSFNGVITGSRFHLYDVQLLNLFKEFHKAFFFETVNHDECYHPNQAHNAYIFYKSWRPAVEWRKGKGLGIGCRLALSGDVPFLQ